MDQTPSRSLHPPKPTLALRVGLVGHRWNRLEGISEDDLERRLAELFSDLEEACGDIHARNHEFYAARGADGSAWALSLLTGLAEGADQAGARAMPAHWTLEALIAMPREAFRQHLTQEGTGTAEQKAETLKQLDILLARPQTRVTEIPAPTGQFGEPTPFERLRDMLLRNVDLLIVVWDEDVKGAGSGGTADIISLALKADLPIVVVPVRENALAAAYVLKGVGPDATPMPKPMAKGLAPLLAAELDGLLAAPAEPAPDHKRTHRHATHSPRTRAKHFLQEPRKATHHVALFHWFKGWFERAIAKHRLKDLQPDHPEHASLRQRAKMKPSLRLAFNDPDAPYDWQAFLDASPAGGGEDGLRARLQTALLLRFGWSDALAVHYSEKFRSSYLIIYALSAAAVAAAVLGLFIPHTWTADTQLNVKAVLVLMELGMLCWIGIQVWHGDKATWHARWLDYRALAETLRHIRMLALVGAHSRFAGGSDPMSSGSSWVVWYARATVREIGLPGVPLDAAYLEKSVAVVRRFDVEEQIAYNRNAEDLHRHMHHFLHRAGIWSFGIAIVVLALFVVGYLAHFAEGMSSGPTSVNTSGAGNPSDLLGALLLSSKLIVAALAALLPAIGAALAGIRAMGDFEGFANRASVTEVRLQKLDAELYTVTETRSLEAVEQIFLDTTEVLAQDLGIWRALYGQKPLGLPG